MIIEDLSYKDALIEYYQLMENGKNPAFNFPLKTLPQFEPVYVVGYTDDSLLVEVVSYYDRGKYDGGSYLKGYVYYKTIHDEPAKKE